MSYQGYVLAAYLVFVAVLLWDFVAPRIRTAQLLRATRLLAARQAAKAATHNTMVTDHPDRELQR